MWEDIEALEWERMVHPDNLEFFDIYISKGEGRAWRRFCSLLASSRALRYFKATPQLFSPTWITDIHWASITTVQIADLMETQKVVEMLRQAPSLQRCILDVVGPLLRDFPAYSTPIEVRSLEELHIRAVRPRFLDFVVLPSLINLSIGIPCYAGTDSYSYGGWDRDGVWSPIEILGERTILTLVPTHPRRYLNTSPASIMAEESPARQ
ncbi:hypothetical protein CC2G_002503 [Coprinopsis cinerea AmutBmut pab1-1]|nr:hypothetical protein CC2G_002503 [Coprinopsis cinerea AmutBmut pab1-1]